jgi:ABC-type uncharacterized transport system fused permease/ATPase subunit
MLGRAKMLSGMRYHTSVIISLFGALGTLGASSRKIMKLGAYADRVAETRKVVQDIRQGNVLGKMRVGNGEMLQCNDAIVFEHATIVTPGNATLVEDLTLRVPLGTNLLGEPS